MESRSIQSSLLAVQNDINPTLVQRINEFKVSRSPRSTANRTGDQLREFRPGISTAVTHYSVLVLPPFTRLMRKRSRKIHALQRVRSQSLKNRRCPVLGKEMHERLGEHQVKLPRKDMRFKSAAG